MTREEAARLLEYHLKNEPTYIGLDDALRMAIAALNEVGSPTTQLDENGLMPCGCGGKAKIWPSEPTQFTKVITDYEVGCTECAMTTGWVRGKQEHAVKVWNTAMGWKGGAA